MVNDTGWQMEATCPHGVKQRIKIKYEHATTYNDGSVSFPVASLVDTCPTAEKIRNAPKIGNTNSIEEMVFATIKEMMREGKIDKI